MALSNLTDIIRLNAERFPNHPAQRFWDGTRWVDRTYRDLWEAIQAVARGLGELGICPGDRIGIMSATRPEWVISDYAILCLDAITVPIYPSTPADQVRHIIEDAGISWIIVENEDLAAKLPLEACRITIHGDASPHPLETLYRPGPPVVPQNGRDDLATLVYTSGTTGLPKGAMLTHGNLISNVEAIVELIGDNPDMKIVPEDVALSFLPLSHILERTGHNVLLQHGVTLAFARSTNSLPEDLLTLKPNLMIAVPRVFEKVYGRVMSQVNQYSALKRWMFHGAVHAAETRYKLLARGQIVPGWLERLLGVYDRLVFKRVREAVGGRLRYVIAGGAPLSPQIGKFFFGVGVPVLEGYGLTETAPVLAVNVPPVPRYGTVGKLIPGVEIAIAADGEILARGPNIAQGYWHLPEDTEEVLRDGWFHTGDVGELSADGYLKVTDRKKYIIVLSTGKNVAPQAVEQQLILSPLIEQAVVLGNRRKYVSALLYLDADQLHRWAVRNNKGNLGDAILLKDPDLLAHVMSEVERTTASLAAFERPKRVALLPEMLTEEHGELTPSLKVKLSVVEQRYRAMIDGLYGEGESGSAIEPRRAWDHISLARTLVAVGAGVAVALIIRLAIG